MSFKQQGAEYDSLSPDQALKPLELLQGPHDPVTVRLGEPFSLEMRLQDQDDTLNLLGNLCKVSVLVSLSNVVDDTNFISSCFQIGYCSS